MAMRRGFALSIASFAMLLAIAADSVASRDYRPWLILAAVASITSGALFVAYGVSGKSAAALRIGAALAIVVNCAVLSDAALRGFAHARLFGG